MMPIPVEFRGVKVGDVLRVKNEYFRRSGAEGVVTDVLADGANLDFYTCGVCGSENCACYSSIEHWLWGELEAPCP